MHKYIQFTLKTTLDINTEASFLPLHSKSSQGAILVCPGFNRSCQIQAEAVMSAILQGHMLMLCVHYRSLLSLIQSLLKSIRVYY